MEPLLRQLPMLRRCKLWVVSKTLSAELGEDYIIGNAGNNVINGNAGDDYIHAGNGDDTIAVDSTAEEANDVYNGGLGDDTLSITGTVVFSATDADIQGIENVDRYWCLGRHTSWSVRGFCNHW